MSFYSPRSSISSYTSMSSSAASSLAMDIRPRSSSTNGSFSAWPYRSCLTAATQDEPNSYLSDEDLFGSEDDAVASPAVEDLSTEDHIAMLRKAQEQQPKPQMWYRQEAQRTVQEQSKKKAPRPSMGKRKKSTQKKVVFASPAV